MDDFTQELLALMDQIDIQTSEPEIKKLAKQRFQVAEKYGYAVEFGEPVSGEIQ